MKNFDRGSKPAWKGGSGGGSKFGGKKPWEGGSSSRDERPTMHRATCNECGKACEVPFRPNGSKPVFCSDCFRRDENPSPKRFGDRDSGRMSFDDKPAFKTTCDKCGDACEVPFRPTGEKPVYCKPCFGHGDKPSFDRPSAGASTGPRTDQFAGQFKAINEKLDAILKALKGGTSPSKSTPAVFENALDEIKEMLEEGEEVTEVPTKKDKKAKKPAVKKVTAKKVVAKKKK
ncbi:MAG: CxxC-x17-CxxC domain-containing protein [Patescibacteria group bacterium]